MDLDRFPRISVIMPAYNAEKTIRRAIDSVLAQSYSHFELIIINDGSTDETLSICREINDSRIVIITQDNGGLSDARNKGIKVCSGDYVTFIDSDDQYLPDFLQKMVDTIVTVKADLAVCKIMTDFSSDYCKHSSVETYEDVFNNESFLSLLTSGILNSACNKCYKVEILKRYHIEFQSVSIVEDLLFNLHYLKYVKLAAVLDEALYFYDISSSSLTLKISEDMFQNYISVHAFFLSLISCSFYPLVSAAICNQYIALSLRYLSKIKGQKTDKEVFDILDKYMDNPLVKYSFSVFKPVSWNERLVSKLLVLRQYRILKCFLDIIAYAKKASVN